MAKNVSESRIPVSRTSRPSLLPKTPRLRTLAQSKIPTNNSQTITASRLCSNNNKQFAINLTNKAKSYIKKSCSTPPSDRSEDSQNNYSNSLYKVPSSLWNSQAENTQVDHLTRLSSDDIGIVSSTEELVNIVNLKRQGKDELPSNIVENTSAPESPAAASSSCSIAAPAYLSLTAKQNSFEHDESTHESLGILTPDQMTDFTANFESSRTSSCENLKNAAAVKLLLGKSAAVAAAAAAARHFDTEQPLQIPCERSPSYEELPLDPNPKSEETAVSTASSVATTSGVGSSLPILSLPGNDFSGEQGDQGRGGTLAASFITSITSITSLEAGYQGDGENSRPASRGAEPLSVAQPMNLVTPICRRQDPMTDSDFFTESDADAHEEVIRGDRRAQIIDGKLFCVPTDRNCPSLGEEMDSSGIYSDFDKRQDGQGDVEMFADDHTTDTGDTEVSLKSQLSPQDKQPVPALMSTKALSPIFSKSTADPTTPGPADCTVISCQNIEVSPSDTKTNIKSVNGVNKENNAPLKKHKMPKRNVISKIKTMIESGQVKADSDNLNNQQTRKYQRTARKNGKWDAVMNKIEAGKSKSRAFKKEVKSRVLQGLGTSNGSNTSSNIATKRVNGDANNNANNREKRKLLSRTNTSESPNHETARSSVRSSASDLSSAYSKERLKRLPRKNFIDGHPPNNINNHNSNIKSNLSSGRTITPAKSALQSNGSTRKQHSSLSTTNRVAENNRRTAATNNNNHNNNNNNIAPASLTNGHVNVLSEIDVLSRVPLLGDEERLQRENEEKKSHLCKNESVQVELTYDSLRDSERIPNAIQALVITVQYLTHQLESTSTLSKNMKTQWLSARQELENLMDLKVNIEDVLNQEREEHRKATLACSEALETLQKDLEYERAKYEKEHGEGLSRQKFHLENKHKEVLTEREKEHRIAIARLNAEHENQMSKLRSELEGARCSRDQSSLLAEIASLRTVLEIKGQESLSLRSEVDHLRRELDDKEALKLKLEAVEARCEDLDAQLKAKEGLERQLAHDNEVLAVQNHQLCKQNKRLSQKNEELCWRLRRKNDVVSVLTNQLTPPSNQRLSKSLDTEQYKEESSNCFEVPSNKSEPLQSGSMVKFMIQKGDSVSWTLDIADTVPERKANSSTRRYVTNGKSVARQGSLRLPAPKRPNFSSNRTRSNSVSLEDDSRGGDRSTSWNPSFQSTPLPGKRNRSNKDQSWMMSSTITETTSSSNILVTDSTKTVEEDNGQIPQEAGGEAMVSEETSASGSEDESSGSSDIP